MPLRGVVVIAMIRSAARGWRGREEATEKLLKRNQGRTCTKERGGRVLGVCVRVIRDLTVTNVAMCAPHGTTHHEAACIISVALRVLSAAAVRGAAAAAGAADSAGSTAAARVAP